MSGTKSNHKKLFPSKIYTLKTIDARFSRSNISAAKDYSVERTGYLGNYCGKQQESNFKLKLKLKRATPAPAFVHQHKGTSYKQ